MTINKKIGTANTTARSTKPQYIVIHYTAGVTSRGGSARNVAAYFANPSAKASADYIVDDTEIVQYNDESTRYSWAVGGSKQSAYGGSLYGVAKNANTVSIELCSCNKTGKVTSAGDQNWYFTSATINNARDLVKHLMSKWGIPASKVIRHYDVNGKYCPSCVGWIPQVGSDAEWQNFKASLTGSAPATTTQKTAQSTATGSYLVRITATVLNVRKGPGTGYAVTTTVKKGQVYTITETQNGWGKLKSGAGWISLSYTQKC